MSFFCQSELQTSEIVRLQYDDKKIRPESDWKKYFETLKAISKKFQGFYSFYAFFVTTFNLVFIHLVVV